MRLLCLTFPPTPAITPAVAKAHAGRSLRPSMPEGNGSRRLAWSGYQGWTPMLPVPALATEGPAAATISSSSR